MWHKPCRTFHPWCLCIKTRCLFTTVMIAITDIMLLRTGPFHDDVIKWRHFPRYWPFMRGIHRSPENSPHNGQWRGALVLSDLRLNKRFSKQLWGWWFETASRPLWRHRYVHVERPRCRARVRIYLLRTKPCRIWYCIENEYRRGVDNASLFIWFRNIDFRIRQPACLCYKMIEFWPSPRTTVIWSRNGVIWGYSNLKTYKLVCPTG